MCCDHFKENYWKHFLWDPSKRLATNGKCNCGLSPCCCHLPNLIIVSLILADARLLMRPGLDHWSRHSVTRPDIDTMTLDFMTTCRSAYLTKIKGRQSLQQLSLVNQTTVLQDIVTMNLLVLVTSRLDKNNIHTILVTMVIYHLFIFFIIHDSVMN